MTNADRKLLVTTSTFPRFSDDYLPRFIFDLSNALVPHFKSVHVLAPGAAEAKGEEKMGEVSVHRYTYMRPEKFQVLAYGSGMVQNLKDHPWAWFTVPFFIGLQVRSIRKIVQSENITVVNSHWMIFQGLAAGLARKRNSFHHVMHIHAGGLFAVYRLPRPVAKWLARFIVKQTDHIICESNFIKESLNALLGFDSRATISCMGVDTKMFNSSNASEENKSSILFVGRRVEKKGVQFLLEAMKRVIEVVPDASLTLVGTGSLEKDLKAKSQALGFSEKQVKFVGKKTHAELVHLFAQCKVVTVPSIVDSLGETEGMPTVILEALAMRKRVVASDVAGASDVLLHGKNGWLARPEDSSDLAEKLIDALGDVGEEIPDCARKTGEYYSWPTLGCRYSEMLYPESSGSHR